MLKYSIDSSFVFLTRETVKIKDFNSTKKSFISKRKKEKFNKKEKKMKIEEIEKIYTLLINEKIDLSVLTENPELKNSKYLFKKLVDSNFTNSEFTLIENVLEYAGNEITSDKNLMLEYIKKDPRNFCFINSDLQKEKEYIKEVVSECPGAIKYTMFTADEDIALLALAKNRNVFDDLAPQLRNSEAFVLKAVKQGVKFSFYEERMSNNAYALEMIKEKGELLSYANKELQDNEDVVLEACKKSYLSFEFASSRLKNDRNYVKKIISIKPLAIRFTNYIDDKELALLAVSKNGLALAHLSDRLKDDEEIVMTAVGNNGKSLQSASKRLKLDKRYLIQALKSDNSYYYIMVERDYKMFNIDLKDKDILNAAISGSKMYKYLYKKYYSLYKKSLKENQKGDSIQFAKSCLTNKKIIFALYSPYGLNKNIEIDLKRLAQLFDENINMELNQLIQEANEFYRTKNIKIYNDIVIHKSDHQSLTTILEFYHLTEKNVYPFIINNKYLDKRMKEALYLIIESYYGKSINLIDIIDLLNEMKAKDLSVEEMFKDNIILKEKAISKKLFYQIYHNAAKDNPILYEYINQTLQENQRRGYKKIIKLGNSILSSKISTLEEYNELFPKYSPEEILNALKGTDLYPKLLEKFKVIYASDSSNKLKKLIF